MSLSFHNCDSRGTVNVLDENMVSIAKFYVIFTDRKPRSYAVQFTAPYDMQNHWANSIEEAKSIVIAAHVARRLEQA